MEARCLTLIPKASRKHRPAFPTNFSFAVLFRTEGKHVAIPLRTPRCHRNDERLETAPTGHGFLLGCTVCKMALGAALESAYSCFSGRRYPVSATLEQNSFRNNDTAKPFPKLCGVFSWPTHQTIHRWRASPSNSIGSVDPMFSSLLFT